MTIDKDTPNICTVGATLVAQIRKTIRRVEDQIPGQILRYDDDRLQEDIIRIQDAVDRLCEHNQESYDAKEKAQLLLGDTYMRFLAVPETIRDQIIVDFIARYQELYPGSETRPTPKEKHNDHT